MEQKVKIGYGTVFKETTAAINGGKKVVIHRGGTGSGKTEDIIIFLLFAVAMQQEGQIITVVSESRPHLEIGAIRIFQKHLKASGWWSEKDFNVSLSRYTSPTGSIIEFFSADRIDKALGARRNWLYGNEINSLKREVWDELARRSEYVVADFNPTAQFWLEDWMENYDHTEVIRSNYKDNPFLPDYERARIEKRANRDPNFRRIHIDCEYGIYEGLVFTHWQQCDDIPKGEDGHPVGRVIYGLDFGYSNDPTALIRTVQDGDNLYVDEVIYQTGMLNKDIVGRMQELGIKGNYDEIYADSAEPKSIDDIKLYGYNIKPAEKGPDSIKSGIDRIKALNLFVTKRSTNLVKELRNYSWVVDKEGRATNKPVDMYNHGIDAIRYAISHQRSYESHINITTSHRL